MALFEAAYAARLPVMLNRRAAASRVSSNTWPGSWAGRFGQRPQQDMTASDLVGRYLLEAGGTRWLDGP